MGKGDREGMERELLEKLQNAEKEYRAAKAEHIRVQALLPDPFDDAESFGRLHTAALNEQIAMDSYMRFFKLFTDLVVYDRAPDSNEIP